MAQTPRSHTILTLGFLLVLGLFMAACEQGETPLGYTPSQPGSLRIDSGAEGASSWILVAPDGTEIHGHGDTLIVAPAEGQYWLLWEPVEAWHSPRENPTVLTVRRGYTEAVAGDYEPILGDMGTLRLDPAPDETDAAWNLYGPYGFFAAGHGSQTMDRRATGAYTVIWESIDGFVTPPQSSGELGDKAVLTLVADYQPVSGGVGEIDIVVTPAGLGAPWQLQRDDGSQWSGFGDLTLSSMSVGDYTIVWGAMSGYEAPGPETASLVAGQRVEFDAEYAALPPQIGSFTIEITPDGIGADWVLTSREGARYEGTDDRRLEGVPVGYYTLVPSEVAGFLTPPTMDVYLTAGVDLTWDLTYLRESDPVGALVVDPEPDTIDAPWQLHSSAGLVLSGSGDQTLENLPVGDYQVAWGDVEGYATPDSTPVSISDGQTASANATYELLPDPLGTVLVDPNPDSINAPWQLELPDGSIVDGEGDRTLTEMPMGDYTLTWGEVEGWETPSPNPSTLTLLPGGVALFSMR